MAPPQPEELRKPSPVESRKWTLRFLQALGVDESLPSSAERPDAYSALIRALLSSATVSSSPTTRVSCTLVISSAATNPYNTLHGGAVAAVAEAIGMACARAAAGDKEMFLGELSTAYLAAARLDNFAAVFSNSGEQLPELCREINDATTTVGFLTSTPTSTSSSRPSVRRLPNSGELFEDEAER